MGFGSMTSLLLFVYIVSSKLILNDSGLQIAKVQNPQKVPMKNAWGVYMGSHIFVKIPMYFAAVSQIEGK